MLHMTQSQLSEWHPPMFSGVITDLDECSVDSDHRRKLLENGELDIKAWHADDTPENIAKDTLRPWGEQFNRLVNTRPDCFFGVCTSREFNSADWEWVSNNLGLGRNCGSIWHRQDGDNRPPHELKFELLQRGIMGDVDFTMALNYGKLYFFDDKVENVQAAERLGLIGVLVTNG